MKLPTLREGVLSWMIRFSEVKYFVENFLSFRSAQHTLMSTLRSFEEASNTLGPHDEEGWSALDKFAFHVTTPIENYFSCDPRVEIWPTCTSLPMPIPNATQFLPDFEDRDDRLPSNMPHALRLQAKTPVVFVAKGKNNDKRFLHRCPRAVWVYSHTTNNVFILSAYTPVKWFAETYWFAQFGGISLHDNMYVRAVDELVDHIFRATTGVRHHAALRWKGHPLTMTHQHFLITVGNVIDENLLH